MSYFDQEKTGLANLSGSTLPDTPPYTPLDTKEPAPYTVDSLVSKGIPLDDAALHGKGPPAPSPSPSDIPLTSPGQPSFQDSTIRPSQPATSFNTGDSLGPPSAGSTAPSRTIRPPISSSAGNSEYYPAGSIDTATNTSVATDAAPDYVTDRERLSTPDVAGIATTTAIDAADTAIEKINDATEALEDLKDEVLQNSQALIGKSSLELDDEPVDEIRSDLNSGYEAESTEEALPSTDCAYITCYHSRC